MKTTNTSNVVALSLALYTLYEAKIKQAREAFLKAMYEKYGSPFTAALQQKLNQRIEASESPLLGELWPHFLRALFPTPGKQEQLFENLVPKWYALYILVLFLDDGVDEEKSLDASVITPLLFEALDLFPDKQLLKQSLGGQIVDMGNGLAPEKNAFMRSLSSAMNQITLHPDMELEEAISGQHMMELLQTLDDIADVETDWGRKKITTIITDDVTKCDYSDVWKAMWLSSELRSHIVKTFTELSVNANTIRSAISVRGIKFTPDNQAAEEFALMEEGMFFENVSHYALEMVKLLQDVTSETDSVVWEEIEGKAKEIFATLAQSS